jgi:hypothetical protein
MNAVTKRHNQESANSGDFKTDISNDALLGLQRSGILGSWILVIGKKRSIVLTSMYKRGGYANENEGQDVRD